MMNHELSVVDGKAKLNNLQMDMYTIGMVFAVALIQVLAVIPTYPGPRREILGIAAVLGFIVYVLFSQAQRAGEWYENQRQKKQTRRVM
ncbi:MAG: hypothetical protein ACHQU0_00885 [Candidatus Paceibacteria bacterium]